MSINNLEKSKVIIVNLTPKPDQFESFKQRTNAVLLNEKHDMEDRLNETEMDENIFINNNNNHTKEINYNKVVETPILSSCSKSKMNLSHRKNEPLMTIDEEIHDLKPNPILNKMSHNYYDNIIKNKNMNVIEESIPIASIDSYADSVYNPTLTEQNRIGYDKYYKDQIIQFPTPQYNRDKRNQTDSIDLDCNIENNPDRFRLNKINQYNQNAQKSLETFYDGKRLWTAAIDLKPPSKENELTTANIKYIYK